MSTRFSIADKTDLPRRWEICKVNKSKNCGNSLARWVQRYLQLGVSLNNLLECWWILDYLVYVLVSEDVQNLNPAWSRVRIDIGHLIKSEYNLNTENHLSVTKAKKEAFVWSVMKEIQFTDQWPICFHLSNWNRLNALKRIDFWSLLMQLTTLKIPSARKKLQHAGHPI